MIEAELVSRVRDALEIGALSTSQITARLHVRTNGDSESLLAAALEVAHDLVKENAQLKRELEETQDQVSNVEDKLKELRADICRLTRPKD
ncbi:MAG: hypothetical protein JO283_13660 [Bradyrhizobium sp.]|nr:hypothetical protein [Bradyrhizobium sp.]